MPTITIDDLAHDVIVSVLYDALDRLDMVTNKSEFLRMQAELNHTCEEFGC